MKNLLIWTFFTIGSFLVFIILTITGLIKKKKKNLIPAVIFLLLTICSGSWVLYNLISKSYNRISGSFRKRTGLEMYSALFGNPSEACLTVLNQQDQYIPRIDCCIWLEFRTCAAELKRVAEQQQYTTIKFAANDTNNYMPGYSPIPEWWEPHRLGDTVFVMQDIDFNDPNHAKILIFSKDSTHAFYCDMAE